LWTFAILFLISLTIFKTALRSTAAKTEHSDNLPTGDFGHGGIVSTIPLESVWEPKKEGEKTGGAGEGEDEDEREPLPWLKFPQ